jgi:hypothetical protein
MKPNHLHKLPRRLYFGVLLVAIMYAENTENWLGFVLLVCAFGSVWLVKLCFPLVFRLGQVNRSESSDRIDADENEAP